MDTPHKELLNRIPPLARSLSIARDRVLKVGLAARALDSGESASKAAKLAGVSRTTLWRWMKWIEAGALHEIVPGHWRSGRTNTIRPNSSEGGEA